MRRYALFAIALFLCGWIFCGDAFAALEKKPVLNGINDTIAVMRGIYREIAAMQENLVLVHASQDLTQKQLDALKALYENALKSDKDRAAMYQPNVARLERQLARLNEFDFDKIYGDRMQSLNDQLRFLVTDLETRLTEYQALFGERPKVDLDFKGELERMRGKRAEAASFLNLD